ncbi:RNA-guided endonuclease TnpB family protein [Niallia sp. 01092]|uniref:RNA-guided endonuclease TnpB family protein n=1 Tax=unclassified Niallia TaxID=2837522 RepID=UPI003FD355FA
MAKEKKPSYVLTMELWTNPSIIKDIESDLEVSRVIYNSCLGVLLKREAQMKRTKKYKKLSRCLRAVSKKLSYYKAQGNKKNIQFYQNEKKQIMRKIFDIQEQFELTEYAMHDYLKAIRNHFGNTLNADFAQKAATRAWNTFHKKLKGESKRVNFIKRGEIVSFEGKKNNTGWFYRDGNIVYGKTKINLMIKENDLYMQEALSNLKNSVEFEYKTKKGEVKNSFYKVKYVRIVKRVIRGKTRYFAQLIVQGFPPAKRNKDGSFRYQIGEGRVGGDLGTSSIAVVGENNVLLTNLAGNVMNLSRKIRLIQRKMDRSKRAMNPKNYHPDGTIKKGKKTWIYSKGYLKLKSKLKELYRKQAVCRKLSHRTLANRLLSFGDEHYWEEMNIKSLQKRSKKIEISEKTGKYKRKKRFGKSIGHRAPAMFINILERKVTAQGGIFKKVNTRTFKASQYNHKTNDYTKKELKERWHSFDDGTSIQRDLYSAFLLMNSNCTGTKTNRKLCEKTFELFQSLHDKEIERIEKQGVMVLNSGIQLKNKKAAAAV